MSAASNAPFAGRPAIIETQAGPIAVAGSDEAASQASYETAEHAEAALRKAQEGCIAVCKRYGLHAIVAVGARHGEAGGVQLSAAMHGDGQFIGTAMARLMALPGWKEAAALEGATTTTLDAITAAALTDARRITGLTDPTRIDAGEGE